MPMKFDYCDHGVLHIIHEDEIWNVQSIEDTKIVLNKMSEWPLREYRHHYHPRKSKFRFIDNEGKMRVRTSKKPAFLFKLRPVLKAIKARSFMLVDPTCRYKVDEGGIDRMDMEVKLEHLVKGGVDEKTLLAAAPVQTQ